MEVEVKIKIKVEIKVEVEVEVENVFMVRLNKTFYILSLLA